MDLLGDNAGSGDAAERGDAGRGEGAGLRELGRELGADP